MSVNRFLTDYELLYKTLWKEVFSGGARDEELKSFEQDFQKSLGKILYLYTALH